MGLLDRIFSGRDLNPPAPMPVQVLATPTRGVALLPSGTLAVWELGSGRCIWRTRAAGPMVALQGGRLLDGQGVCRDLESGEVLWQAGVSGLPVVFGPAPGESAQRLGLLGWQRLWIEGGESRTVKALDPSPEAASFWHQGQLYVVDPGAKSVLVLNPDTGAVRQLAVGARITQGLMEQGRLLLVRERLVQEWSGEMLELQQWPRRHDRQCLTVGAECSLGVGRQGLECWDDRTQTLIALKGQAPTRPTLLRSGQTLLAETWTGLAILRPGEQPKRVDLPTGRRDQRPLDARTCLALIDDERVLLAAWPPLMVSLSTGRCLGPLATPSATP